MRVRRAGGGRVAELERATERILAAAEGTRGQIAEHERLAVEAEARRPEAAADPEAFAELAEEARRHRVEAERLEFVLRSSEADLEAKRSELARARLSAAVEDWKSAGLVPRNRAVVVFTDRPTGENLEALIRAREESERLRGVVAALGEVPSLVEEDEPDFPADAAEVAAALIAGPQQPRLRLARALAQLEQEHKNQDRVHLAAFEKWPSPDALKMLPQHLHAEAERIRAARVADGVARHARARGRQVA